MNAAGKDSGVDLKRSWPQSQNPGYKITVKMFRNIQPSGLHALVKIRCEDFLDRPTVCNDFSYIVTDYDELAVAPLVVGGRTLQQHPMSRKIASWRESPISRTFA